VPPPSSPRFASRRDDITALYGAGRVEQARTAGKPRSHRLPREETVDARHYPAALSARGFKELWSSSPWRRVAGRSQKHRAKTKQSGAPEAPRAAYQAPVLRASPCGAPNAVPARFRAAHRGRPVLLPVGQSFRGLPGKRRSGKTGSAAGAARFSHGAPVHHRPSGEKRQEECKRGFRKGDNFLIALIAAAQKTSPPQAAD
jgi:hypothetical protein